MKGNENLGSVEVEELLARRAAAIRDLMVAKFQLRIGQLENSSMLPNLRKSMARLNTELRRREIQGGLEKGTLLGRNVALPQVSAEDSEASSESPETKKSGFGLGFIRDTLLGKRS